MSSVCSPTAAATAAAGASIGGRAQRKLGCGPGISPKWNPRAGWVDLLSLSTVDPVKKIRNDTSQSTLNFYNSSSTGEKYILSKSWRRAWECPCSAGRTHWVTWPPSVWGANKETVWESDMPGLLWNAVCCKQIDLSMINRLPACRTRFSTAGSDTKQNTGELYFRKADLEKWIQQGKRLKCSKKKKYPSASAVQIGKWVLLL